MNCLEGGHRVTNCGATGVCKVCGDRHHTAIHLESNQPGGPPRDHSTHRQQRDTKAPSTPQQTTQPNPRQQQNSTPRPGAPRREQHSSNPRQNPPRQTTNHTHVIHEEEEDPTEEHTMSVLTETEEKKTDVEETRSPEETPQE